MISTLRPLAATRPDPHQWDIAGHDGSPIDPEQVTASLTLPERDVGPLDLTLQALGPGQYVAHGAQIPFSGTWDLEVVARTTEIDQDRVVAEVPVP